ncbi:hypothetical protein [Vreelandella salicampi]|uniref:Uncharacterized protein n=1 Tax=Vreelandella salicampi TaxID=1449798 RepID=A0A7Z0LIW9_9GAMM|nr:hypothetical protein [Halomonas salicampi]NYS59728.1 hypothetical protein [Halomonas salicampi]
MTPDEHEHVIDELQAVIDDTQATLKRFENTSMEDEMPEDYEKLLTILDDAVKQQREHTRVMLGGKSLGHNRTKFNLDSR